MRRLILGVLAVSLVAALSAPAASAHHDELRFTRTLDSGEKIHITSHGDPLPTGTAARGAALSMAMARAAAVDSSPWLAAGWCGQERSTDNVANEVDRPSAAVHAVYAYPADQADRFATYAPVIQQLLKSSSDIVVGASGGTKGLRLDQGTNCGPVGVHLRLGKALRRALRSGRVIDARLAVSMPGKGTAVRNVTLAAR